jgi:formate hydrogenlyase subunit 3/multisubunit Na+/H+ antiporter MnhD subunit
MTPIVAALGSVIARDRRVVDALQCGQAGALLASSALVVGLAASGGQTDGWLLFHVDGLSAWLDLIIGLVGSSGTLYAVGYMGEELDRGTSHSAGSSGSSPSSTCIWRRCCLPSMWKTWR